MIMIFCEHNSLLTTHYWDMTYFIDVEELILSSVLYLMVFYMFIGLAFGNKL